MTPAVDEQRVSATITAIVSDATGRTLFGGRTEEVTARVFDVAPYVVITGTRDLSAEAGSVKLSEGDSGGVSALSEGHSVDAPDVSAPSDFTDTLIKATIECVNTPLFDEADPQSPLDSGSSLFDPKYHQNGSLVWAFQMPCTPNYGVPNAPNNITNYSPPVGNVYKIDASNTNESWNKGDNNSSDFAR